MTTQTEALKLALEALKDNQHLVADNKRHAYVMEYNSIIEKCEEALANHIVDATKMMAQQSNEQNSNIVKRLRKTASKGVSVWGDLMLEAANEIEIITAEREAYASSMERMKQQSNEQSKCNHTKTITRADIDGNQIETTCGECGERVAQQPQDVVRGLLSNEQVEPVAKVNFYTGKIEWLMPVSFDIPVTIDVPPMYLYTHPPVPYVVEPRTAQPEQEYKRGYADAMNWKVQNHLEHLQPKEPEQEHVVDREVLRLADAIELRVENKAERMVIADKLRKLAYTTPPQRTWVGLTQQDINIAFDDTQEGGGFDEFAQAIEATLRRKNT